MKIIRGHKFGAKKIRELSSGLFKYKTSSSTRFENESILFGAKIQTPKSYQNS